MHFELYRRWTLLAVHGCCIIGIVIGVGVGIDCVDCILIISRRRRREFVVELCLLDMRGVIVVIVVLEW